MDNIKFQSLKKPFLILDYEFDLLQIKESENYINILNDIIKEIMNIYSNCSLRTLIKTVHTICPELETFCNLNKEKFNITSVKDKGLIGKIVEFYLFGNLPNNESCPDMEYGDIKTTHFKNIGKFENKQFNAKERLTLTNFGDPNKQSNIDTIADKQFIQETKYYEKIKKGIILIFQHDDINYNTIDKYYEKKIIGIVFYNLDDIFENYPEIEKIFQDDFIKIKTCILEKNVSQCGQQYLHIHKHGCKLGLTRAFGFTNKFLTKLVSIYLNVQLITKGRSEFIEF